MKIVLNLSVGFDLEVGNWVSLRVQPEKFKQWSLREHSKRSLPTLRERLSLGIFKGTMFSFYYKKIIIIFDSKSSLLIVIIFIISLFMILLPYTIFVSVVSCSRFMRNTDPLITQLTALFLMSVSYFMQTW